MQKKASPNKRTQVVSAILYSALIIATILLIAFYQMRPWHMPSPAQTITEIVSNPAAWENKTVQLQGIIQRIELGIIQPFNCWLFDPRNETTRIGVKWYTDDFMAGNYVEVTGTVRKGYAWVHPDYPGWWTYFIEANSIASP